jgi:aldehyde:ferredoxin oxidoreductase
MEPVRTGKINHLVDILKSATGWETSLWEIMKLGERGTTMARCFNVKHGATRTDDALPDRIFEELEGGALKGSKLDREEFKKAIDLYYQMMGWDISGIPTEGKLYELDIGWMNDDLTKYR